MQNDPIADMLTRMRNASLVRKKSVILDYSRIMENILKVMKNEGFIQDFEIVNKGNHSALMVTLKYLPNNKPKIEKIKRISKPGRRVYTGYEKIRPVKNGFGIAILTTPKGVMSDKDARKARIGGEVLCEVW